VKCFYEVVARLDTDAACEGAAPSGGTGDQVQIRFGFVPYSTNVNVGRVLPPAYLANKWSYQSRIPLWKQSEGWVLTAEPPPRVEAASYNNVSSSMCNDATAAQLDRTTEVQNGNSKRVTTTKHDAQRWDSANNGTCYGTRTTTDKEYVWKANGAMTFDKWRYAQIEHDVSALKNGSGGYNASFTLPIAANGTAKTINWDGCIEERATTRTTSFSPIPDAAKDLRLDLMPSATDASTLWGPALPSAIYLRRSTNGGQADATNWNRTPIDTTDEYRSDPSYFCPKEARKLRTYATPGDFQDYVNGLYPTGNTYHDIGLLWGARLMWPTGMFRSENEYTDRGGEIDRHMIFMTDGDTVTQNYDYAAYGFPWFDRRQTDDASVPDQAKLNEQVNLRFSALCTAIKNNAKGITLWVINFGEGSNSTTKARLESCATSPDYFFDAADSKELQAAFRKIADDISQLRLTK
jgi:hypothetical protein